MELEDKEIDEIEKNIPNKIFDIQKSLLFSMELFLFKKGPETKLDIATVCMKDAVDVGCDAVYALRQAHIHLRQHNNIITDEYCKFLELNRCKFYLDDISLRHYAGAEHIAYFIIAFKQINDTDLNPYRSKHTSMASTVGLYMIKEHPSDQITSVITNLNNNTDWSKTREYRNKWVHEQPPLIEGLGIVYKRKSRWVPIKGGYELRLGFGDTPDYTINNLLTMMGNASEIFVETLDAIKDIFFNHLKDLGVKFKDGRPHSVKVP